MNKARYLLALACLAVTLAGCGKQSSGSTESKQHSTKAEDVARGEYLAQAGDCVACHTARGGEPFAGGFALASPFGTIYSPNITPDNDTGIGKWTADDFWRALHEGKSKDGTLLYPAFPFTNYTKVTREDADAIFAYLKSLKPVSQLNRENELRFPYNQRELLTGWRTLYFKAGEYQNDPKQSAEWNRGAYLVEGLGHCSACHTSRNLLGAERTDDQYSGGLIPVQNWFAPSLTSNKETGLGDWDVRDIADLLKTGVSSRGAVYGPMAEVVQHSLQHLTDQDINAMAVYLKSVPRKDQAPEIVQVEALMRQGASLYETYCTDCHRADGEGVAHIYPTLANNQSITMETSVNPIRMVLNGGFPPSTATNPRPYGMPPFAHELSDQQVAAVVTYIRKSWNNQGSAVTPAEVSAARGVPID